MQVTCTNCQSKIRVPDSAAGKKGKCPKCGTIIAIPALDAPEEATAEPVAEAPASPSFDFAAEAPPSKNAGRRDNDEGDAVEAGPPRPKSKAGAMDDEVEYEDDQDEDRPRKKRKANGPQESIGFSVTSMVLGIVSVLTGGGSCCCVYLMVPLTVLLAATAIVLGVIGMKKGGKVMAIVGISLGGLGLLLSLLWTILVIIGFAAGGMGNNMNQFNKLKF
jgi:predicted Zn finger-like uncharacterized protein